MDLYPDRTVEITSLFDPSGDRVYDCLLAERSRIIHGMIDYEIKNGEHLGRTCIYMGIVTTLPDPYALAEAYGYDFDRFRYGSDPNCIFPEYLNCYYFYPKADGRPLLWFILKCDA